MTEPQERRLTDESIVVSAMENNKDRLANCKLPHDFAKSSSGNTFKCSKCKGYVTLSAGVYYKKGLIDSQILKQGEEK